MLSAALALALTASAQDIPTQDARIQAPNFAFFATRSSELVLFRDDASLRRQVQQENSSSGQNLGVRVLAGRPVLVYFWGPSTYCRACDAAMAVFESLHEEFALDGVQVVGLGLEVPPGYTDNGRKYSHLTGSYKPRGTSAAEALGLNAIPSWALIDASGTVFARSDRGVDKAYLTGKIQELLRGR